MYTYVCVCTCLLEIRAHCIIFKSFQIVGSIVEVLGRFGRPGSVRVIIIEPAAPATVPGRIETFVEAVGIGSRRSKYGPRSSSVIIVRSTTEMAGHFSTRPGVQDVLNSLRLYEPI